MPDPTIQPDESILDFCRGLKLSAEEFTKLVEDFAGLRVLVIGDTIFDRYSYSEVQGLTSKNRILSSRFVNEETQCGGALAVARHVAQFCPDTRFLSLVGCEDWVDPMLNDSLKGIRDVTLREASFTTIIKQRFVEPVSEGKEMTKLFSVNFIDADPPKNDVQQRVYDHLANAMKEVDVVLLADFGHGMMQEKIRDLVQDSAPYLALNCQTNSNNHGFNIINRQYRRADAFSLDKQELLLACGHRHVSYSDELENLRGHLSAGFGWLTRGPVETIGNHGGSELSFCPPLEREVVDTVGAGDAFFSVASLAAAKGLPVHIGTFLGQLAGAQAVRIVGNVEPISKDVLLRSASHLLNLANE